jgi:predicted nuclease of predicted toxin-antitoxin system
VPSLCGRPRITHQSGQRRVKLLFDQNLSPQLAKRLSDIFPESKHVEDFRMDHGSDRGVCDMALREGFVIVSQDEDFAELAYLLDPAPKVIWLTLGNTSTTHRERILRLQQEQI